MEEWPKGLIYAFLSANSTTRTGETSNMGGPDNGHSVLARPELVLGNN